MSADLVDQPSPRPRASSTSSVLHRRTDLHIEYIDVDGVCLRVGLRPGRGRPMLLFSSIGMNIDMMRALIHALDDIELIVFDMPGVGESSTPRIPHGFRWTARLSSRLLDRLGYDEPVNVAGIAWGGALAQQFALDYPKRTNRLVLAATSIGVLALPAWSKMLKRLITASRRPRNGILSELAPWLYGGLIRQRPDLLERGDRLAAGPSTRGYVNQLVGSLGWTSAHRLYRLRCPTLIMGGDDDPVEPLVNIRLLYWLIPKSYLHVVRGGGICSCWCAPTRAQP